VYGAVRQRYQTHLRLFFCRAFFLPAGTEHTVGYNAITDVVLGNAFHDYHAPPGGEDFAQHLYQRVLCAALNTPPVTTWPVTNVPPWLSWLQQGNDPEFGFLHC